MLTCEISLAPLETIKSDEIVNQAVQAIKGTGVQHEVGNMSTYLYSEDPNKVWEGIKAVYDVAQKSGTEFSLSIQLSNNT